LFEVEQIATSLGIRSQREIFAVAVLDAIGGPLPGYKSGANLYDIHISWGFLSSRFFMIFRPI